eukprot:gb/GECH01011923.1/.p1 GENE.gb/GECH01011923.1/~~gb/GECH01011923.1/.p1  ORF type:complete len:678 (+),score=164.54 gb/GECH01011923.1/:1-2034(+)
MKIETGDPEDLKNPFTMPKDGDLFEYREKQRHERLQQRQKQSQLKVYEKNTLSGNMNRSRIKISNHEQNSDPPNKKHYYENEKNRFKIDRSFLPENHHNQNSGSYEDKTTSYTKEMKPNVETSFQNDSTSFLTSLPHQHRTQLSPSPSLYSSQQTSILSKSNSYVTNNSNISQNPKKCLLTEKSFNPDGMKLASGNNTDDGFLLGEDMDNFLERKRQRFLLKMSLDTKQREIQKNHDHFELREKQIQQGFNQLEKEKDKLTKGLQKIDMKAVDASSELESASKERRETENEIRRQKKLMEPIQTNLNRIHEALSQCDRFESFLKSVLSFENIELKSDEKVLDKVSPERLLETISQLESKNLLMIQHLQEKETKLDAVKQRKEKIDQEKEQKLDVLQRELEMLENEIHEYETEKENTELPKDNTNSKSKSTGNTPIQNTRKNHLKSNGNDADKSSKHKEMDQIHQEIKSICKRLGMEDIDLDPLSLLMELELKLEALIGNLETIPDEVILEEEKAYEQERRRKAREAKKAQQQREQEERSRRALERSRMKPKKHTGKPVMERSKPFLKRSDGVGANRAEKGRGKEKGKAVGGDSFKNHENGQGSRGASRSFSTALRPTKDAKHSFESINGGGSESGDNDRQPKNRRHSMEEGRRTTFRLMRDMSSSPNDLDTFLEFLQ